MNRQQLKEIVERVLSETAKGPNDLPADWLISIDGDMSNVSINLYDKNDVVGSLDMHRTGQFMEINETFVRQGWGPLLYDLALEVVNQFDDEGLMPDRTSVSQEAHAVWDFYKNQRSDVEASPLPDTAMDLAGDKYVSTSLGRYDFDSSLSFSYRKTTGSPILRYLIRRDQLEADSFDFDI